MDPVHVQYVASFFILSDEQHCVDAAVHFAIVLDKEKISIKLRLRFKL